jgi:hypothetical protein
MRLTLTFCFFTLALSSQLTTQSKQDAANVLRMDNSDWWSNTRTMDSNQKIKMQERRIAAANFQILRIQADEKMLHRVVSKLGKATIVERGDAATGRNQLCYVSAQGEKNTYLIFESGEVDYGFYLFKSSKPWRGVEQCVPSALVSSDLATGSGVRLGQSQADVISILGAPSAQRKNELVYLLHQQVTLSAEQLKKIQAAHPELSEKELQESYGVYDWGAGIVLRFQDSKLIYLSISVSETN